MAEIPPQEAPHAEPSPPVQSLVIFSDSLKTNKLLLFFAAVIIFFLGGAGGYYAAAMNIRLTSQSTLPNQKACRQEAKLCPDGTAVGRTGPNCTFAQCPTTAKLPTEISPIENRSCTQDNQCPTGYKCLSLMSQGVDCPAGQTTINNNGTTTFIPYTGGCQPTQKIVKGICKLTVGQPCNSDNDCYSGLTCHSGTQDLKIVKKCTSPSLGDCSPGRNSCPSGYTCVQKCGPPISRGDEPPTGYFCEVNELAGKPRNCPICLTSSTNINTPGGQINVKKLTVGMPVWTVDKNGQKVQGTVLRVSRVAVPSGHYVVDLILNDGRQLLASSGHPTTDGRFIGDLKPGDPYDTSKVVNSLLVPYGDPYTYDVLPSGDTGFYWADGILVGSTLKS